MKNLILKLTILTFSTAFPIFGQSVKLTWSDNSTHEKGFVIERKDEGSDVFAQIAATESENPSYTGTAEFIDDTAVAKKSYVYRVAAWNDLGLSDYTNEAAIQTKGGPINFPTDLESEQLPTHRYESESGLVVEIYEPK